MKNPHDFTCNVTVRFKDIDAMGHVNNAVILTYFEEGRKALLHDELKPIAPNGFEFILARIECDYLLPVRLDDRLRLAMAVIAFGTKSFTLAYTLMDRKDETRIFARGTSIQVCYDYGQRQSIPVSDALKSALAPYTRRS